MRKLILPFLLLAASAAHAAPVVDGAWLRLVPGQQNAAGYLILTTTKDDELTGVTSDCCEAVELHSMTMDGDRMQMREVDEIEVEAGKPLTFAPMGYHIMFIGIEKAPKQGEVIPVTFEFESGDTLKVDFTTKLVGAK